MQATRKRPRSPPGGGAAGMGAQEPLERGDRVSTGDQERRIRSLGQEEREQAEDPRRWDELEDEDDPELALDPKHLLIVKDGTIRVAESLDDMQRSGADGAKASGTWTKAEHDRFLKAMELYPKGPWKAIAEIVGTRTVRQTQTHAQKYREKMARRMRGLRNRNGTLQAPQVSSGDPYMPLSASTSPSSEAAAMVALGSSPSSRLGTSPVYYTPVIPHRRFSHPLPGASYPTHMIVTPLLASSAMPCLPQSQHQHQHQHHQHQHQQHGPQPTAIQLPPALLPPTAEFDKLSESSISSAFLGNEGFPPSWESASAASEGKDEVPDFDESMDFLMHVYSSDPNQIGATLLAAPAEGAPAATGNSIAGIINAAASLDSLPVLSPPRSRARTS